MYLVIINDINGFVDQFLDQDVNSVRLILGARNSSKIFFRGWVALTEL